MADSQNKPGSDSQRRFTLMGDEEKKALDIVVAEMRNAIECMPALEHSLPAEKLMLAAYTVGVNDEAKHRLGFEITSLVMARIQSFVTLWRLRGPEGEG